MGRSSHGEGGGRGEASREPCPQGVLWRDEGRNGVDMRRKEHSREGSSLVVKRVVVLMRGDAADVDTIVAEGASYPFIDIPKETCCGYPVLRFGFVTFTQPMDWTVLVDTRHGLRYSRVLRFVLS